MSRFKRGPKLLVPFLVLAGLSNVASAMYVNGNPVRYVDPYGLYTEVVAWDGAGLGSSAYGHVSANVNGVNYSWSPGGWDTRYPSAVAYNARQREFRGGKGFVLNLTPEEEIALQQCLTARADPYNVFSNNCTTPPQQCLPPKLGLPGDKVLPGSLGQDMSRSPGLVRAIPYPSPKPPATPPFSFGR